MVLQVLAADAEMRAWLAYSAQHSVMQPLSQQQQSDGATTNTSQGLVLPLTALAHCKALMRWLMHASRAPDPDASASAAATESSSSAVDELTASAAAAAAQGNAAALLRALREHLLQMNAAGMLPGCW